MASISNLSEHKNWQGINNDEKASITIVKLGKYTLEDAEAVETRLRYENPTINHYRPYTMELNCIYNMAWYPSDIQH